MPEFRWYHGNFFRPEAERLQGGFCMEEKIMRFEVNMIYQKEDIEVLQKGTAIRQYRGKPLKRFLHGFGIFLCAYFLLIVLLSFLPSILGALGIVPIGKASTGLIFAAMIVSVVLAVYDQWGYRERYSSRVAWRRAKKEKRETIQFQFFEEDFQVHVAEADARGNYSVIQDVLEGPAHYLLFIGRNQAYILNKKNFLEGDPAVFGVWISSKVGKEIIKM